MGELIRMNIKEQYKTMLEGYKTLADGILPTGQDKTIADDPAKMEWAKLEGFTPAYDPNADEVSWIRKPEPAYQVPELLKLQGSMSPETLTEVYPAFAIKQQYVDPVLQKIAEAALSGEITQQRAQELVFQLMSDVWGDMTKTDKKATGAAGKSSSFAQTVSRASKHQRVAGVIDE